jgi:hypothetical protein
VSLQNIVEEMGEYWSTGKISDNLASLDNELFDQVDEERMRQKQGNSYGRELIWSHVSRLNDDMIKQYLTLDSQTNNRFAELAEEKKEWFENNDMRIISKQYINKKLNKHSKVFLDILYNPKKIRFLENYVTFVNAFNSTNIRAFNLPKYLKEHNLDGERIDNLSESCNHFYCYDFISGMTFANAKKSRNLKNSLNSLYYGIDKKLKQRFQSALSLKHKREKIIENYIKFVNKLNNTNIKEFNLPHYLKRHNLDGERVDNILESCNNFYNYDFVSGMSFSTAKKQKIKNNIFNSLSYGIDKKLKQRFQSALSLKHKREKIIKNYINYVNTFNSTNIRAFNLPKYLKEHNLDGERVNNLSESCLNFYNYDFIMGTSFSMTKKHKDTSNVFDSLSYGLKKELKKNFEEAILLKCKREKIIRNYIDFVEKADLSNLSDYSFMSFLLNYNLDGKKVKNSRDSCENYYRRNFITFSSFETSKKKMNQQTVTKSLTYRLNENLKQKLKEAISLKCKREKIISNYIKFVENSGEVNLIELGFQNYLYKHDFNGNKVEKLKSCYLFSIRDFRSGKNFQNSKQKNQKDELFNSITYELDNKIIQEFQDTLSLKSKREQIVNNYIDFVNNNNFSYLQKFNLAKYLSERDLEGDKVKPMSKNSINVFYRNDFVSGKSFSTFGKKHSLSNLIKSLTHGFNQDLIDKLKDSTSLKAKREQIIINYISFIDNTNDSKRSKYGFRKYILEHNIDGNPIKDKSESLEGYLTFDFEKTPSFECIGKEQGFSKNQKRTFDSIAYNINPKLIQKFSEMYWEKLPNR